MDIYIRQDGFCEVLFIEPTEEGEHENLMSFARVDEPLIAKIKQDRGYLFCRIDVRKVSDEKSKKEKAGPDQKGC